MPFLLMRTASALAAGFLMTGSPYAARAAACASASASTVAARGAVSCPAHWATGPLPVPAVHSHANRIQSVATLSPTDAWLLRNGYGKAGYEFDVYHLTGGAWDYSVNLDENDNSMLGSNGVLYVAGTNQIANEGIVWSYDGSQWTDLTPPDPPLGYEAVAVAADGTLVVAGGSGGSKVFRAASALRCRRADECALRIRAVCR